MKTIMEIYYFITELAKILFDFEDFSGGTG